MHRNMYIYIFQNAKEEKLSLMPEQKKAITVTFKYSNHRKGT